MKLILSFLMIPMHAAIVLAGLCGIACYVLTNGSAIHGTDSTAHMVRAITYLCISGGLLTSVITTVYATILMVLGFIVKSWRRALVSGAIAALAVFLWRYMLSIPYFLD